MVENKNIEDVHNPLDKRYKDLLENIIENGKIKGDRTGTGTISVFGRTIQHDMSDGFPLLTSKKMFTKGVVVELLWFLGKHMEDPYYARFGRTNIKYLVDNDCNIWVGDALKNYNTNSSDTNGAGKLSKAEFIHNIKTNQDFTRKWGDLGPVYGEQWCNWNPKETVDKLIDEELSEHNMLDTNVISNSYYYEGINQIENLINDLKNNPDSRRLIVTAWNPSDLDRMILPPCHYGFQCYTEVLHSSKRLATLHPNKVIALNELELTEEALHDILDVMGVPKRGLSLMWDQRSVDTPLGLPFNIASYAFLLEMLAKLTNMIPMELIGSLGDTHIYLDQLEGVEKQLNNETYPLPTFKFADKEYKTISDFNIEDFIISDYQHAGVVNYPLSN